MRPVIRSFAEYEWAIYKNLRLAALAESPDAFGSTVASEARRSDAEWARRLAAGVRSGLDLPVVAEIGGQPIGLAWGRIDESDHAVAHLYQVWVRPAYRRRGAGGLLLAAVTAWAIDKRARYLKLAVVYGDTPALRLYVRAGFAPAGWPEPMRPGADVLNQRVRLELTNGSA